jgi:hypothetical protein
LRALLSMRSGRGCHEALRAGSGAATSWFH